MSGGKSVLIGTGTIPARMAPQNADREVDRIEHDERNPSLALDPGGAQPGSKARRRRRELGISEAAPRIGDGEPVAVPFAQMPVDEIIDRVAVAFGHSFTSSYALLPNLDADRIAERRQ